jgi:hypothetical protein
VGGGEEDRNQFYNLDDGQVQKHNFTRKIIIYLAATLRLLKYPFLSSCQVFGLRRPWRIPRKMLLSREVDVEKQMLMSISNLKNNIAHPLRLLKGRLRFLRFVQVIIGEI